MERRRTPAEIPPEAAGLPRLILKKDKDWPLRQRHPWIFSGAVDRTEGEAEPGGTVAVLAADGEFLAVAGWNPASQICARVWEFGAAVTVDRAFLRERLQRAVRARRQCGLGTDPAVTDAFRLVHAEADGLPGLIVDRYADVLIVQILTLAMEKVRPLLVEVLAELLAPAGIYERSDVDLRRKEGLEEQTGLLYGGEPPAAVRIVENGLPLLVDVRGGQKTGFFLDQRENRRLVAEFIRRQAAADEAGAPPEVLNAFSYTGGFGVAAAMACPRARITNLDASADALRQAAAIFRLNGIEAPDADSADAAGGRVAFATGNAFEILRQYRDRARRFDAVILDPPKFAASHGHVEKAARGYKDLNLLGIKLLRPGGLLATFSCSGAVTPELFQKIVAGAAVDAGRAVQILARLGPGPDHPVAAAFPEGEYLKGLLLRVQ